ncbi:flagellar biosynthesis anti-sigma factor FlgM [Alicyclobacillus sp. TC]|uniref:flagellar biosynthesis anti-sigma factor FlgM n=1 Tax=Alicyclobacillus sp. TC TaxID=2606450 RepID=UPI0019348C10|nr:flagellar biosynthesis anti-sigma factor FlgM [Alicyclobacillus sp. TC]QRF22631.1 flagellar biosynthesis anti-sigma factor FlgM [Alicyclobacillus sp. TC]
MLSSSMDGIQGKPSNEVRATDSQLLNRATNYESRQQKINRIKQQIQSGVYSIQPERLAKAILQSGALQE